jgi:hypothetical protein
MSKKELIELEDCELDLWEVDYTGLARFKVSFEKSCGMKTVIYLKHKELKKLYKLSKKAIKEDRHICD